jgi:hypothetical protein
MQLQSRGVGMIKGVVLIFYQLHLCPECNRYWTHLHCKQTKKRRVNKTLFCIECEPSEYRIESVFIEGFKFKEDQFAAWVQHQQITGGK